MWTNPGGKSRKGVTDGPTRSDCLTQEGDRGRRKIQANNSEQLGWPHGVEELDWSGQSEQRSRAIRSQYKWKSGETFQSTLHKNWKNNWPNDLLVLSAQELATFFTIRRCKEGLMRTIGTGRPYVAAIGHRRTTTTFLRLEWWYFWCCGKPAIIFDAACSDLDSTIVDDNALESLLPRQMSMIMMARASGCYHSGL